MQISMLLQIFLYLLFIEVSGVATIYAVNDEEALAKLRLRFLEFAPLISMDTAVGSTEFHKSTLAHKCEKSVELLKSRLDSQPTLDAVIQRHAVHLFELETSLAPLSRVGSQDNTGLFVARESRVKEDHRSQMLMLHHDERCRNSYQALLPIVEKLAGSVRQPMPGEFSCLLENDIIVLSGREQYSNCSIKVRFTGVGGESSTAFYFIPELSKESKLELRVPLDFVSGPAGVVKADVRLFCDEAQITGMTYIFDQHLEIAIRNKLVDLRSLCRHDPYECMEQLRNLSTYSAAVPCQKDINELRGLARKYAQQELLLHRSQLSHEKAYYSQLQRIASRESDGEKSRYNHGLEKQLLRIEMLENEISRLYRVR